MELSLLRRRFQYKQGPECLYDIDHLAKRKDDQNGVMAAAAELAKW